MKKIILFLSLSLFSFTCLAATTATKEEVKAVARIYSAAFDRDPRVSGLNFWVGVFEGGSSLAFIAQGFYESPEFTQRYGDVTNNGYVDLLYINVLGRPGKESGMEYWNERLDSGTLSRADVLASFANSPENQTKTDSVFDTFVKTPAGLWDFDLNGNGIGDQDESSGGGQNDFDGDGVPDNADNCIAVVNPGQENSDNSGAGDACEVGNDQTSSPGDSYTFCSDEGGYCAFSGVADVAYGAAGVYTEFRPVADGIDCNNLVFGDPLPNTFKSCYYRSADAPPPSSNPPSGDFRSVVHYTFDELDGDRIVDQSGNGQDAENYEGDLTDGTRFGKGIEFHRVYESIYLPDGIVQGLYDFTIAFWVTLNYPHSGASIFEFAIDKSNTMYFKPAQTGFAGPASFGIVSAGVTQSIYTDGPLARDEPQHVVITKTGDLASLYINGVLARTEESMTLSPADLGNTTVNLIGRGLIHNPSYVMDGVIDDFRIYNWGLPVDEVAALYSEEPYDVAPPPSTPTPPAPEVFTPNTSEIYLLQTATSTEKQLCLEASELGVYGPVRMMPCRGTPLQKWRFTAANSEQFQIKNVQLGNAYCLEAAQFDPTSNSGDPSLMVNCSSAYGERFNFRPALVGSTISPNYSGYCLTGNDQTLAGPADGTSYSGICNKSPDQDWIFTSWPNRSSIKSRGTSQTSGLLAYYKLDENAADFSGNAMDGTLSGPPFAAKGIVDGAMGLNGSGQHAVLPEGMFSLVTDFTIATWVSRQSGNTDTPIFEFGNPSGAYMSLIIAADSNSHALTYRIKRPDGSISEVNTNVPVSQNQWTHVAVTQKGSESILYVNGAFSGVHNSMGALPTDLDSTVDNWLGRGQFSNRPYLKGLLDDFRIYDTALNAKQIETFYKTRVHPSEDSARNFWKSVSIREQLDGLEAWQFYQGATYSADDSIYIDITGHIQGMARLPDGGFVTANTYKMGTGTQNYTVIWDPSTASMYKQDFDHGPGYTGGVASVDNIAVVGIGGGAPLVFFEYTRDVLNRPVLLRKRDLTPIIASESRPCNDEFPAIAYHEGHGRHYLFACNRFWRSKTSGRRAINNAGSDFWQELSGSDSSPDAKDFPAEGGRALLYDRSSNRLVWLAFNTTAEGGGNEISVREFNFAAPPSQDWTRITTSDTYVWPQFSVSPAGPSVRYAGTVYEEIDGRVSFAISQRNFDLGLLDGDLFWQPTIVTAGMPGFVKLPGGVQELADGLGLLRGVVIYGTGFLFNEAGQLIDGTINPAVEEFVGDTIDTVVNAGEDFVDWVDSWAPW